jgi:hypothetical protein
MPMNHRGRLYAGAWRAGLLSAAIAVTSTGACATVLYSQSFDTDTVSLAETLATYGASSQGLLDAQASAGRLRLAAQGQGSFDFGAFAGDIRVTFVTSVSGQPGLVNTALRVGDNTFLFHPGYPGGAFRIEGPDGHGNTDMGFTPGVNPFNEVTVTIAASTGATTIRIVDGADTAKVYAESFTDVNYVPGVTLLGLSTGSVGGGYSALFDNVLVTSVPEPATFALLLSGLAGLARATRSKLQRS